MICNSDEHECLSTAEAESALTKMHPHPRALQYNATCCNILQHSRIRMHFIAVLKDADAFTCAMDAHRMALCHCEMDAQLNAWCHGPMQLAERPSCILGCSADCIVPLTRHFGMLIWLYADAFANHPCRLDAQLIVLWHRPDGCSADCIVQRNNAINWASILHFGMLSWLHCAEHPSCIAQTHKINVHSMHARCPTGCSVHVQLRHKAQPC